MPGMVLLNSAANHDNKEYPMRVLRAIASHLVIALDEVGEWLKAGWPSRVLLHFLMATEPENRESRILARQNSNLAFGLFNPCQILMLSTKTSENFEQ